MTEKTIEPNQTKAQLLILYILGLVNLVYLGLLFVLETFAYDPNAPTSSVSPVFTSLLPLILVVVASVDFLLFYKVFLPKAVAADNITDAFSNMLIGSVLVESIGIFGLLIGLLDLFAVGILVRWEIVAPFLILSLLIQLFTVQNSYTRKLNDLATN